MAAATMAGLDSHRMEKKKLEYFSSINSMAKKIMQEREKIKAKHGSSWDQMSAEEQDSAIDNWMMDPQIRARYAMHRVERDEVVCYPKLLIQTGQKIVHFGEEDIVWQDEHSAPFSWETKSQLEFSLIPGSTEPGIQTFQNNQSNKTTPAAKASVSEGRRPEEESSFWKISAERSRLDGEKADFQSLTPSQIKSIEKGEKPLPSYLRQEAAVSPKEPELSHPPPAKPTKQRAPKPPAPQPPISITPGPAPPASASSGGWERSQSTLPSVSSTVEEMFLSNQTRVEKTVEAPPNVEASPTFSQFNTSSSILKTGFDFLDNW